ncbi:MAG: HAD family hydrolase [Planctomycetota bacterium]|nr:HAD family hydrolase [Planctomycetota bacterium]
MNDRARRPAVFLDRDGVLTREDDWVLRPDQVELLPGAAAGVRALNQARIPAIVVTNQSALARGWIDETGLAAIHARLGELLAAEGARVDAIYFCPHHPSEGQGPLRRACDCRKPEPGLLFVAAREHALDLGASWMVGDAQRDVQAARAAGVHAALVLSGKGRAERARIAPEPEIVAERLDAAIAAILPRIAQGR